MYNTDNSNSLIELFASIVYDIQNSLSSPYLN